MDDTAHTSPHVNLTPWSPSPTPLPEEWVELSDKLAKQARGKPRPYIMETKYDGQRVGNLLRSWGLPWDVVMAGYMWEFDRVEIECYQLPDTEEVIHHILYATTYLEYIRDDILPPLLTPPYDDLGGLLIAVAIYYETFWVLQELSDDQPLRRTLRSDVDRVERTMMSIAKRLGMWHFKRAVEDITEQLRDPIAFAETKREYERILERDRVLLENTQQWLMNFYRIATKREMIEVTYIPCGVVGLKRRRQSARITQTSIEKQLNGFDLSTFEVIVPTVAECYNAPGILSQLGVIEQVSDRIATPKANGYSHIYLYLNINPQNFYVQDVYLPGNDTYACQMQIATPVMQATTWYGGLYPGYYNMYTKPMRSDAAALLPLEQLWHSESGRVFATLYENITTQPQPLSNKAPVVVYEGKSRKPIMLPKGATALDLAYTLDQSIGAHAVYAIVNNRKSPLHRILDADDIIEIITSTDIQAQESWLQRDHATISAVRRQIRKSLRDRRGYKLLSQELERYHYILPPEVLEEQVLTLVKQHSLGTVQAYLERLDSTNELIYTPQWAAHEIMQRLAEQNEAPAPNAVRTSWVPIVDPKLTKIKRNFYQQHFCGFCQPTYPRDAKIMGRVRRRDNTLVVHKESCPHLLEHPGNSTSPLLPMMWQLQPPMFRVAFYIAAQDRKGLILDLTRLLRRYHCDLLSLNAEALTKFGDARIHFTIEAHSYSEVLDILQALYRIDNVTKAGIDASATSPQVYDHLQQLRQRKETIPQSSLSEFLEEQSSPEPRSIVLENPYDISRPPAPHMFFGRSTEIERMQRELCNAQQGRALLLHGPRRSGKTSICANFLERQVRPPFWGVHFSLLSFVEHNEETILERIAEAVGEEFHKQLHRSAPSWEDFHDPDPQACFRRFLECCLNQVPHSRLILILDEFGGAFESYAKGILKYRFFTFWKELMNTISQLSLVFVLPTSSQKEFANVFSFVETLPLEFLETSSARQLLVDPLREQNIQIFSTTATLAIKQTGGNPYYMTLIGHELISYLNGETSQQQITDKDLRMITDQLIRPGTHQYFDFLRLELLNEVEVRLIQGLVEITTRTRESKVQLKKLAHWLNLSPSLARPHLDRLNDGLILHTLGRPYSNPYYSFKIDLVRKWLIRNQWFFADEHRR